MDNMNIVYPRKCFQVSLSYWLTKSYWGKDNKELNPITKSTTLISHYVILGCRRNVFHVP